MDESSNVWIEQCEAARGIRDDWGTRKALGYLVGEKLLNYIRAADSDSSWELNVPKFTAEIRQIFTDEELQAYFATATRIGVTRRRRRHCTFPRNFVEKYTPNWAWLVR
jgi:hypothetical protein